MQNRPDIRARVVASENYYMQASFVKNHTAPPNIVAGLAASMSILFIRTLCAALRLSQQGTESWMLSCCMRVSGTSSKFTKPETSDEILANKSLQVCFYVAKQLKRCADSCLTLYASRKQML